jgi:hypothetical protein
MCPTPPAPLASYTVDHNNDVEKRNYEIFIYVIFSTFLSSSLLGPEMFSNLLSNIFDFFLPLLREPT